jgi:hypothetical protein
VVRNTWSVTSALSIRYLDVVVRYRKKIVMDLIHVKKNVSEYEPGTNIENKD